MLKEKPYQPKTIHHPLKVKVKISIRGERDKKTFLENKNKKPWGKSSQVDVRRKHV